MRRLAAAGKVIAIGQIKPQNAALPRSGLRDQLKLSASAFRSLDELLNGGGIAVSMGPTPAPDLGFPLTRPAHYDFVLTASLQRDEASR